MSVFEIKNKLLDSLKPVDEDAAKKLLKAEAERMTIIIKEYLAKNKEISKGFILSNPTVLSVDDDGKRLFINLYKYDSSKISKRYTEIMKMTEKDYESTGLKQFWDTHNSLVKELEKNCNKKYFKCDEDADKFDGYVFLSFNKKF